MAVAPISCLVYKIPRTVLDEDAKSMVGIDRGCSLTKAAYVQKNGEGNTATHYAVHCVLFNNSDFEDCLHFLKENALLPATGIIRVTGTGCDMHREVIKSVIGLDVEFMNESLTIIRGFHFLLTHAEDRDSLFFPTLPKDLSLEMKQIPELREKYEDSLHRFAEKAKGENPDDMFPCIFVLLGSAVGCHVVEKDGGTKVTALSLLAGKSLVGMGRALTGISTYDELMELAANGSCGNVDTTAGEVLHNGPESPYGHCSKQLLLFPFGKFIDQEKKLEDCRREDLAATVVRMMAINVVSLFMATVKQERISRVVIGGHGILGEPLRKNIVDMASSSFMNIPVEPKFLINGALCAIGAMIANVEDFQLLQPF